MVSHQVATQWAGLSTVTPTDYIAHDARQGTALCLAVILLSWAWLLSGAGMSMGISATTTWAFPPGGETMAMPMTWTMGLAGLMLIMWSTMMWAMMLPAMLLDTRRDRRSGSFSPAFVGHYMAAWIVFSVAATALHFLADSLGWLDSMRMWSMDRGFSIALVGIAALSQLARWKRAHATSAHAEGNRSDRTNYALRCLCATAPVMLLLFVGGVMNLVWIVGLTVWAITQKRWSQSRWHSGMSVLICSLMIISIWDH